ncbi:uncharacterized protein [Phyllobates terribilis]|uniref:uncharacterized protein n=1 Tax=Phyllobates terribilis TaxID=111132 RepID=UPI003CCAD4DB
MVNFVESLRYNLLRVAQLCDEGPNKVTFTTSKCFVKSATGEIILRGKRVNNTYIFDPIFIPKSHLCLATIKDQTALWHQRLGHVNLHLLQKLRVKEVRSSFKIENVTHCANYVKGKQVRSSFISKPDITTKKPLELHHMDLYGPMHVQSPGEARYIV